MYQDQDLVVIVHVHENEFELNRLLWSIKENDYLSNSPLIIINNSTNVEISKKISNLCTSFYSIISLEVNKFNWPTLRSRIINSVQPNSIINFEKVLDELDLGVEGWNVHYARNIGMILAKLIYPQKKYVLNFDSDIVVPRSLKIEFPKDTKITCLNITECPDLSRFEWLTLYALLIQKKYKVSFSFSKKQYCHSLIEELSTETLHSIFSRYSYFDFDKEYIDESDSIHFPTREEYHGACYIISIDEFYKCPYPSWFDNDWFFFKTIRGNTEEIKFINQYVLHESAKKDALNQELLNFEEEGQIVNIVYDYIAANVYSCKEALNMAILDRKKIIDDVMQLIELLRSEKVTEKESKNLSIISKTVQNLLLYLISFDNLSICDKINKYKSIQVDWQTGFKELRFETPIFDLSLNRIDKL